MINKLPIMFRRTARYHGKAECFKLHHAGSIIYEDVFPKSGDAEASALGPHGTVITQHTQIRIGNVICLEDVNGVLSVTVIVEGLLEQPEREALAWHINNLLGLDEETNWHLTVLEKCEETHYSSSDSQEIKE